MQYGLDPFLASTRTLVALVDAGGHPLAGNSAFEILRGDEPAAESLPDMIVSTQRRHATDLFASVRRDQKPARGRFDFGSERKSTRYECLLIPAGPDATLVFAEPVHADSTLLAANEQLATELNAARSALADKTAELQALVAQVDTLAHTDSLTYLPNRRSILSDLQRQVTYAERYNTPLAISMLDLDGFKSVNDRSGHPAGDKILGMLARELRDRIRQPDQIGRYGGDEFLVILPNSTAAAASEQATRLCQHVRRTSIPFADGTIQITLSAGITQYRPGADTWQSLLERADRALYEAKRLGGDQWLILEA
jgi:diguanylate cyclase (GGDEF)-like protein